MKFIKIMLLSVLISLSCSYIVMSTSVYRSGSVMTGSDLFEEIIIALCLGIAIGCVSPIFNVEKIPVIWQFVIHFVVIVCCVLTAGYVGNWYDVKNVSSIVYILILFVVIYVGAWGVMKLMLKQDVTVLNEQLQKRRGDVK